MTVSLQKLIDKSRLIHREKHKSGESEKLGNLRAGTTGIMADEGDIAGACHRQAFLRSKGVEIDPPTWDKYIMFELGFANETVLLEQLKRVLDPGQIILVEEEIPIAWQTSNGTNVTGRPDLVICNTEVSESPAPSGLYTKVTTPKPALGIELKSVHSLWVAREVLFNRHPKLANLVQAAHYMWKLGDVPYKLFYKSYSQLGQGMAGSDWIAKMFPRAGEPGSEYIEWTEVSEAQAAKGKGPTIKHIKQFEIVYDLRFDKSGRLQYRVEGSEGVWTNTIISKQDISRYFEYVSKMEENKELGPRPTSVDAVGDKLSYSVCKYCAIKSVCDSTEKHGFEKWLSAAKAAALENQDVQLIQNVIL